MQQAAYCLCPSGVGFGWRTSLALAAGCIPVIVQPMVAQPFDDLLPYSNFSLSFRMADVKRLPALLRAIPPERVCSLRREGARYSRLLMWQQPGGLAYDMLQVSLCKRALRLHRGPGKPPWAGCADLTAEDLLASKA
jgi:hypothetical protein